MRKDSQCRALRNAIAKYGRDNFTFEVVATATSSEELNDLERQFVATSMVPDGYNLLEGGDSHPSEETRKKISDRHKVIQNLPEVKALNSLRVKQAMARPEVKERQRKALHKRLEQPEEKARMSATMVEIHSRPGQKVKRSAALKAKWASYSPEERAARIEKQRAAYTPKIRDRMRKTSQEVWSDPGLRASQSEKIKLARRRRREEEVG